MQQSVFKPVAIIFALIASSATCAASYSYTENYVYVGKPRPSNADIQLQSDLAACDATVGAQNVAPSAAYRDCMIRRGWRYTHLTRSRAPADPYFSSNAKVRPGHFIDHDNGMDCQNTGGAEVCDPPNGTVHYFDPDQNLPCTRTESTSICTNF